MVTKLKIAIIAGVAIVAIAGITVGIVLGTKSNDDDDTSCSKFNAPSLEFNVEDDRLVASWTEPDNLKDCSVTYKLKHTIDDGNEVVEELQETQFKFEALELVPCTKVVVTLTAVNGDGDESDEATETFTKGVDAAEFINVGVSELSITTVGNEATVTWVRPTDYDKCDMQYQVKVGAGEPSIVNEPMHTTSIGYCATTIISVAPVIGDVFGKPEPKETTLDVSPGFTKVDSLSFEKIGDKLKAAWEKPESFDDCVFTYKLTFSGAGETDPIYIADTEKEYDLTDGLCAEYTIEVTPVVDEIEGESDDKIVKTGVDADEFINVGVSELSITTDDNQATVTWVRPTGYDECDMQYQVKVGTGEPSIVNEPVHTTSLEYCEPTTISVVPVVGDVVGKLEPKETTASVSSGFAKVASLSFDKIGDKLKAAWEKPEGFAECVFTYKLTFSGAGETDPIYIPDTDKEYDLTDGLCAEYTIEVTPVVDVIEGESDDKIVKTGVDADDFINVGVSELLITTVDNQATVTWVRPTGYDECDMQYQVKVGTGEPSIVNEPVHTTSLEYCEPTTISVVPVVGDVVGKLEPKETTASVSSGFAKVASLSFDQIGDKLKAAWEKPEGFAQCKFTYKLTFSGAGQTDPIYIPETEKEYDLTDGLCAEYTIEVTPVVDVIEGESDDKIVKTGVDADEFINVGVSELLITTVDNQATVTWVRPTGYDECDMQYQVKVGAGEPSIVNEPVHTTSLEYCEPTTISVVPVVGDVVGKLEPKETTASVSSGFAKVASLSFDKIGDKLKAAWEKPEGFAQCVFTYKLTFSGAGETDPIYIPETEKEYDLTDGLCAEYTIEVTPVVDVIEGESDDKIVKTGVDAAEFINVGVSELSITTDDNQATVTWVRPTGYDECDMQYQVKVGTGEPSIVNEPVHTTSLEYCEPTTISVVPVVGDVVGKLEPKETTASVSSGFAKVASLSFDQIGDKLKAAWEKPEGFAQCVFTYKLTFSGAGETDPIYIPETEKEYDLTDGLCAEYTIEVTPVVDVIEGESDDKIVKTGVEAEFGKVTELTISITGRDALIKWVGPEGFENCPMEYRVIVGDRPPEDVKESQYQTALEYCDPQTIKVVPVIENIEGEWEPLPDPVELELQEGFGMVTDFTYEALAGNELRLQWVGPTGFEKCNMQYQVTVDGTPNTADDPEYKIPFEYCATYDIQIVPVIGAIIGSQYPASAEITPDAIGKVEINTPVIEENKFKATWKTPSGLELCDLQYTVDLKQDDNILVPETPLDVTTYEFDLTDQCPGSDLEVTVVAKYDTISGDESKSSASCPDP